MPDTFRVTSYEYRHPTTFSDSTNALQLRQDLAPDYFLIIQMGGAGDELSTGNKGPNQSYIRVTHDGFGSGDLGVSDASDEIILRRTSSANTWKGTVDVIECLGDQATTGFTLRDISVVEFITSSTTTTKVVSTAWSDISQVGTYGGKLGGGSETQASNAGHYPTVWGKVRPSGTDTILIDRDLTGGGTSGATFSVYVVEWGSEWQIESGNITGSAGGAQSDAVSEYDHVTLNSIVTVAESFVLAYGMKDDNGIGDGWDGDLFALGNGISDGISGTTDRVACGADNTDNRDVQVFVHRHANAAVQWSYGTWDNSTNGGLNSSDLSSTFSLGDTGGGADELHENSYSTIRFTEAGRRFAILSASCDGVGTSFPRPIMHSRWVSDTTINYKISRSGLGHTVWHQGVDLSKVSFSEGASLVYKSKIGSNTLLRM